MDVFDYINKKLRDTFAYFKSRTKKKYEGDRFEEWVVSNSNIQRNPKETEGKSYWRLLEWRGDKYVSGWYSISNLSPDLVLECISDKANNLGTSIAVECKYRNKRNFFLEPKHIENYEEYIAERKPKIDALFYIFGFGWKNDAPEEVYLIPSEAIYTYDIDSRKKIKFKDISKKEEFKNYQVILDKSKGKYYIQYKYKQNRVD